MTKKRVNLRPGLGVSGNLVLHTWVCTREQTESRKYNRYCKYPQEWNAPLSIIRCK